MTVTVAELRHYGVKGMKWGVRKGEGTPTAATVTQKGKKLKGAGGENQPASKEAVKAREIHRQAKASGIISLSNQQLREYNERLNLEQNALRLQQTQVSPGAKFAKELLVDVGKDEVRAILKGNVSPVGQMFTVAKATAKTAAKQAQKAGQSDGKVANALFGPKEPPNVPWD